MAANPSHHTPPTSQDSKPSDAGQGAEYTPKDLDGSSTQNNTPFSVPLGTALDNGASPKGNPPPYDEIPIRSTATSDKGSVPSSRSHQPSRKPSTAQTARRDDTDGEPPRLLLEKFSLYETKTRFYVIGSCQSDARYRVLKIDRTSPPGEGLTIIEDGVIYSRREISSLLKMIEEGNRSTGGLQRAVQLFYGIVGFIRFTAGWYMIIIKQRASVALIGGHYVYHCEDTLIIPIHPNVKPERAAEETRFMNAFHQVDLSKNFYFSYTYDLTNTLQSNLIGLNAASNSSPDFESTRPTSPVPSTSQTITIPPNPVPTTSDPPVTSPARDSAYGPPTAWGYNDKFVWNHYLLRSAFGNLKEKSNWVLPLVHGFVDQAKLSVFGRTIYITLIARRSRHFAGARFLKRGINDEGYVANDVETEQIVSEALTTPFHCPDGRSHCFHPEGMSGQPCCSRRNPNPRFSSYVQHRGSIPLYWSQDTTNMSPRPPIDLTVVDPFFAAAALHFDDLFGRYGTPVVVLNLIKGKERAPRESKLLPAYGECIQYLNQFLPAEKRIRYIPFDIAAANKSRDVDVIGVLEDIAEEVLETTQFFHSGPEPTRPPVFPNDDLPAPRTKPLLQSGVCRTNCIDGLDRTNAAQFVIGKAALGHQLYALGIAKTTNLSFDCDAAMLLTGMYHDHGDTIALQYGGSHVLNTIETYRKIGAWTSHSRDMIEGLKRYYANSFVDADKQTAINLFLGVDAADSHCVARPVPSSSRRSYRDWYTRKHLEDSFDPLEAEKRLRAVVNDDGDYWMEYYRPRLFTEISRHFSYRVNSSLKYSSLRHGTDPREYSPFIPRVSQHPQRLSVGAARKWMNNKESKTQQKRTKSAKATDLRLRGPPAKAERRRLAGNTIEAVVSRLMDPAVDAEEAQEYDSYVHQYRVLTLSQDLSDKDLALYTVSSGIGQGDFGADLAVDAATQQVYQEHCTRHTALSGMMVVSETNAKA